MLSGEDIIPLVQEDLLIRVGRAVTIIAVGVGGPIVEAVIAEVVGIPVVVEVGIAEATVAVGIVVEIAAEMAAIAVVGKEEAPMSNDNTDLTNSYYAILFGLLLGFLVSPVLATIIFIGVAIYLGAAGFRELTSQNDRNVISSSGQREYIRPTSSAPMTDEPTIADKIKAIHTATDFKCPSCGATVGPTDTKCKSCGSFLVASANLPKPEKWGDVEIGQSVQITHPKDGKLTLPVVYRIYYGELWQKQMRQNVPWTLTGNYYVGLGLDKDIFLLNWQSRFYLLDSHSPLTDMDINRYFAPYARKFAASNQTASVFFEYGGGDWSIEDIGRFRIEFAEGNGVKVSSGAIGRFIHASDINQMLVVEDYQSGGSGSDTLWQGYRLDEKDIKF